MSGLRIHLGVVAIASLSVLAVAADQAFGASGPDSVTLNANVKAGNIAKPDGELPKIYSPMTPATLRINVALSSEDSRWLVFVKDCVGTHRADEAEASRKAKITMNGPRYLSIVVHDEFGCAGAAHPDNDVIALVYDLKSGAPLNWSRLLPKALGDGRLDTTGDGAKVGVLASDALDELYVKALKSTIKDQSWWSNCSDVVSDPSTEFVVWPDAAQGGIVLEPMLPHVAAACGENAAIPTGVLRKLGAPPGLVDAIDAAKKSSR